jgi:Fic family protein
MIETPPTFNLRDAIQASVKFGQQEDVRALVSEINERYEYWSDVKYKRRPKEISAENLWACVKVSRLFSRTLTFGDYKFKLFITDSMQRMCHQFDMNLGGYMGTQSFIPSEDKNRYLVSSNMEEAIASSQMEGAATTRRVAKDMLRKAISPRNRSEQMIRNNYETIRYILEHKDEDFTVEQLLRIHKLMTDKTLSDKDDEGRFRTDDNVVVENGITHEVVHTPPSHDKIESLMDSICLFFNEDDEKNFIHPIIKAIILHFLIGFIHPFADGNGRTARAFFYWYMLKRGYWLTEYLSISSIISKSKGQYEKAYLYTENDENDLGYFIEYHLRVMEKSYEELRRYIQRKIEEKSQVSDFIRLGNINERQAQIIKWLNDDPSLSFTVKELKNRFSTSDQTIREDLNRLVDKGFLDVIAVNKVKKNYLASSNFHDLIKSATPKKSKVLD